MSSKVVSPNRVDGGQQTAAIPDMGWREGSSTNQPAQSLNGSPNQGKAKTEVLGGWLEQVVEHVDQFDLGPSGGNSFKGMKFGFEEGVCFRQSSSFPAAGSRQLGSYCPLPKNISSQGARQLKHCSIKELAIHI